MSCSHAAAPLPTLRFFLAEILNRASDIAGVIAVCESALPYAPAEKTLTARLETLRREASAAPTRIRESLNV